MKVIDEKPWSHVLMEQGEDWILTLLIRTGPVENDVTIKLSENEISAIKSDKGAIQTLLAEIKDDWNKFSEREIRPPVWP